MPHELTPKQRAFLCLVALEALYGGAAGGGKSDALLDGALQYVDYPGYAAIIFRRTYADLALPGALMDRAEEWLGPTDARWNSSQKQWAFPSGATLSFGYMERENHKYRYQSAEFQYIGFDELTQFTESQYRYLFSRLRRLADSPIPLRMRSASNPGNIGHEWVKQRFLTEGPAYGRPFIRAKLDDNPYLDRAEYIQSLNQLDPVTRQQLLDGDWGVREAGGKFRREWFEVVEALPRMVRWVRFWDLASTAESPGSDPDWTVGLLLGRCNQRMYWIADVRRLRGTPQQVDQVALNTASQDPEGTLQLFEQEPGSAGAWVITQMVRLLAGYHVRGIRSTGSKEQRANPVSSQAERGNIKLLRAPWNTAFLDELDGFPSLPHDDQVDALSGAFKELAAIGTGIDVDPEATRRDSRWNTTPSGMTVPGGNGSGSRWRLS